jgi:hypothetical protein
LNYSWNTSPVQNTANASGVPSGNYTVTVTDANGCTATAGESVNNTGAPTITLVSQTDLDCNGDTNGTATVSASGGTGTLTVTWNTSPVQTGTTANNLGGGTHIATVTDASGCSASLNVTIVEPAVVSGVASSTNSSCSSSTGTATVVASGGDGNYTYLWSNNGLTSTISNLAPGTYSVIITDGNGCTGSASTSLTTVTTANIDAGIDVIILSGTSTTLTATGGIIYVWTPSDSLSCTNCSNPVANPSETTTYYVTGTDASAPSGTVGVALARGLVQRVAQGLELTDRGRELAKDVVRRHRLWESYLVDRAGVSADHVHDTAERLEHLGVRPLEGPSLDPHGREIPR